MLIDILQDLYDALYKQDTEAMKKHYQALEHYGMDRETAVAILKAGEKYFGRKYRWEEEAS